MSANIIAPAARSSQGSRLDLSADLPQILQLGVRWSMRISQQTADMVSRAELLSETLRERALPAVERTAAAPVPGHGGPVDPEQFRHSVSASRVLALGVLQFDDPLIVSSARQWAGLLETRLSGGRVRRTQPAVQGCIALRDSLRAVAALALSGRAVGGPWTETAASTFDRLLASRDSVYSAFPPVAHPDSRLLHRGIATVDHLAALDALDCLRQAGETRWNQEWLRLALLIVARSFNPSACRLSEWLMLPDAFPPDALPPDALSPDEEWALQWDGACLLGASARGLEEPGLGEVARRLLQKPASPGEENAASIARRIGALAGAFRQSPRRERLGQIEVLYQESVRPEGKRTPLSLDAAAALLQAALTLTPGSLWL